MTEIYQIDDDLVEQFREKYVVEALDKYSIYDLENKYKSHPLQKSGGLSRGEVREAVLKTRDDHGVDADALYEELSDKVSGASPTSLVMAEVYDALETAFSVGVALPQQFENGDILDSDMFGSADDASTFNVMYGFYAGAKAGLDRLDYTEAQGEFDTGINAHIQEKGKKGILDFSIAQYIDALVDSTIRNESDIHQFTAAYLEQVSKDCAEYLREHPDHLRAVDGLNLEIGDTVIEGVNGNDVQGIDIATDVTFDDVVGNEEFIEALRGSEGFYKAISDDHDIEWEDLGDDEKQGGMLEKVMWYDPEEETNPFGAFPTSLLATGKPGTGKTHTLKAAANYAVQRAREMDKPLIINTLASGDVHSKYHGESAQNLEAEFDKVTNPDNIGILYIEDAESIFPARGDSDSGEDSKTMNTLLNKMQGIEGDEERGNYLIFMTTNYATDLDQAVKSRAQVQVEAKGPDEKEHYEEILPLLLKKNMFEDVLEVEGQDDLIHVDDWEPLAEKAEEYEFTGRDLDNLTRDIASRKSLMPDPNKLAEAETVEEQAQIILEAKQPIYQEEIAEAIEEKNTHLGWQEERERDERIEEMLEEKKIRAEADELWEGDEDSEDEEAGDGEEEETGETEE